ncbi:hypothetical protein [Natrialba asiatica]|uniref:Small CPxCG-related zinc finger protein n=1 Tax=Natrialba asiatica (strain ATCC 700177 / DSM 12278 / JCM 9576 / FERM P-10747 / NBRC 102637 / 172P1) TaxID=29540 RepID=M0B293_NATA1|nr:hypothetical protein [Natrialba asiatica]ELZ04905.1 hypothetical protein C481_03962 [Natrialba asiatica DSM 12278]
MTDQTDSESEADADGTGADTAQDPVTTGTTGEPANSSLPRCPRCDRPIAQTTMIGPGEAVAGPCGCRVAPNVGKRSDSD